MSLVYTCLMRDEEGRKKEASTSSRVQSQQCIYVFLALIHVHVCMYVLFISKVLFNFHTRHFWRALVKKKQTASSPN